VWEKVYERHRVVPAARECKLIEDVADAAWKFVVIKFGTLNRWLELGLHRRGDLF